MTELEAYYNKFNEEKRLDSRHGRVEFVTSMHYIHQCLEEVAAGREKEEISILDIGAGTGCSGRIRCLGGGTGKA